MIGGTTVQLAEGFVHVAARGPVAQRGNEVLALICGWFADRIDTVDLQEARALLAAWA
jgi:hypothetical protein